MPSPKPARAVASARDAQAVERDPRARSHLDLIEKVVHQSAGAPDSQARVLAAARGCVAGWLQRGATFENLRSRLVPRNRERKGRAR